MNATSHDFYSNPTEHNSGPPEDLRGGVQHALDLDAFLVPNPDSTVLFRARDDRLQSVGVFKGDLLLVDRSIKPTGAQIVVAHQGSELCLGFLGKPNALNWSASSDAPLFDDHQEIWGVVTYCLHRLKSL